MNTNSNSSNFPHISMTAAHFESIKLIKQLDQFKTMDFESPEKEQREEFSTDYLFGESRGKMLGVLVCRNSAGNITVIKAFSSQYNGFWNIPGWVPPVLKPEKFNSLVTPVDKKIKQLDRLIAAAPDNPKLKKKRKALSVKLMSKIHNFYRFTDFTGKEYSLQKLWRKAKQLKNETAEPIRKIPGIPGGTGDCCAPKLLNYAALNGFVPVSMAEFYYGKENASGTKKHGVFYPPCREKCEPLLSTLAPGLIESALTIYYKDEHIVVVEKPAGMLSVPGKGPERIDSVAYRITRLFPESISHPAAHRLDMATSGLIVFGLTKEAHRALSIQFQKQQVNKRYTAVLSGVPKACEANEIENKKNEGIIELAFRLDPENRPYQIYDEVNGKIGITEWNLVSIEQHKSGPRARVIFIPKTGRTHQLRLHASHPKGLGCPIAGDRLYGNENCSAKDARLLLHAEYLEFTHPETGKRLTFYSSPPF